MSITYRFEAEIVVIEITDECTTDQIADVVENSINDPYFSAKAFLLINLNNTKQVYHATEIDQRAMARFMTLIKHFNNRMAFVAPSDISYGLLRMGEIGADHMGIQVMVFREFDSARRWLLS